MEGHCDPPSGAENRWNASRCIDLALERGEDLLLCEDDIDIAPDLTDAVAAARATGWPVTFFTEKEANHPPHYLRDTGPQRPMIHRVQRFRQSWYGTQCILLPLEVMQHLAAKPDFHQYANPPLDGYLRTHVRSILQALPNPVQHRSPPPVRGGHRRHRVSPTFDTPREGGWSEAWQNWTTRIPQS